MFVMSVLYLYVCRVTWASNCGNLFIMVNISIDWYGNDKKCEKSSNLCACVYACCRARIHLQNAPAFALTQMHGKKIMISIDSNSSTYSNRMQAQHSIQIAMKKSWSNFFVVFHSVICAFDVRCLLRLLLLLLFLKWNSTVCAFVIIHHHHQCCVCIGAKLKLHHEHDVDILLRKMCAKP